MNFLKKRKIQLKEVSLSFLGNENVSHRLHGLREEEDEKLKMAAVCITAHKSKFNEGHFWPATQLCPQND